MFFVNSECKIFEKDGKSIPYYRLHVVEKVEDSYYCRVLKSTSLLFDNINELSLKLGDNIDVYFDRFGRAVKVFKNAKS